MPRSNAVLSKVALFTIVGCSFAGCGFAPAASGGAGASGPPLGSGASNGTGLVGGGAAQNGHGAVTGMNCAEFSQPVNKLTVNMAPTNIALVLVSSGTIIPGDLNVKVSAFAWVDFDPQLFLWSDIEREHELFSHLAETVVTPP